MTHTGSQLTFEKGEGGGEGITEKRDPRGVTTDLGGAQGRNKQKRYVGGVKTDLGGAQGRNKQKRYVGGVKTDLLDV